VDIEKHLIRGFENTLLHVHCAWTLNITWYQVWKLVLAYDLAKHMVMGLEKLKPQVRGLNFLAWMTLSMACALCMEKKDPNSTTWVFYYW
jgi:hypothetical protein